MTTAYIAVQAGTNYPVVKLIALDANGSQISANAAGNLEIPTLTSLTINNANDVYTWSQLNESAKLQLATTSTNSLSTNLVVEELTFFGNTSAPIPTSAQYLGVLGLSVGKVKCDFEVTMGSKTVTGVGYVTGLAPAISADAPVWVTPITITVSGEYAFTTTP
jgi:hypothetical protein